MLHMALRVFVSFYEAHFIGGTYDAKVHALDEILHVGKFKMKPKLPIHAERHRVICKQKNA